MKQPWDPSIQALAALPEVVKRLADDIQWTTDLGNAFLAQQSDVMDAVQRMRKKAQDTGKAFQAKLFQYREINLARVRESQYDAPQFSSPTREIAVLLGSAIVDDPALTRLIIPLLENQDEDARVRRTDSIRAVEIEAAFFLCHEQKRNRALVGEFATIANGILEGRGETVKLDPGAVGDHLRSLGLFSERLGQAGRGIRFVKHVRHKVHQLAWAYDVRSIQDGVDRCEFCAEVRVRYGKAPEQGN